MSLVAKGLSLPGRLAPMDLALARGELVCLVGPNGSGKTSLLQALAGIGKPRGSVSIDGENPWTAPPARRPRLLTYLPAARDIAWPLPASDLIRLGGEVGDNEVGRVLDRLELRAWASRRTDRMSTGERSRVLIARALAPRPRLLLLDEPVSNLDPLWQLSCSICYGLS
jgi:iron complex transport system ATP-binding protein